ncbi:MAG: hypothetical protein HOP15_05890, partial [Planctomycetes bacterium]|nr:hypothetical protein [Planctomycetota bacterium]
MVVPAARTSPASVSFTLFDAEADPARVRLRYFEEGDSLQHSVDLLLGDPLSDVPTNRAGEPKTVEWDFGAQLGGAFKRGVTVVVTVNGEDDLVSLGNATVVNLGNDAPEVLEVGVPDASSEATGLVAIPILLRDSGGDPVYLEVLFEHPSGVWLPARPAGLPPGVPTPPALSGVATDADGLTTTFVWDSAFDVLNSVLDLSGVEANVRLRVTACDGLLRSAILQTPAFPLDNNLPPSLRLLDASLVTNADERAGISIPLSVTDAERDPIDVVVQWRLVGSAFPPLPTDPSALRAALADPVLRRSLQIVSERPVLHDGRVGRLPAGLDPLRHVRLPELGHDEIHALARGLAGRVLEFPRPLVPRPVAARWTEHV